ncbi:N-acetyltransferase [Marinilongibacter aquaticus]|uniref:GNAT family N-acetyltransferase n=1 Tax=Marinilongibacter aquaticus TaxID=2975157 RepID=UPI0021BDBB30|nr:GNAT family N-acetyltransferase [Marinilongibacter aquaticus]UBM60580.1 N-acetyltransferase [Marinilongibacter aquaticus]
MEIKHVNGKHKGVFKALDGDEVEAGRMTYSWAGEDKLIIDHTEVNPDFKGQGVGKELLLTLVDYVREHKIKVIPLCPFAKSMFERMPEIQDVLQ